MFADVALAARIDRAESRLTSEAAEAVRDAGRQDKVRVVPISGGTAVYAGPSFLLNKAIGLGLDGPVDLVVLKEIESFWQEQVELVRIELSNLAHPASALALTERGYRLHGFENVLGRSLETPDGTELRPGLTVGVVNDAREAARWIDIAVSSFLELDGTGSAPDDAFARQDLERVLSDFAALPGFIRYLGWIDGIPVGEAALRIDQGLAQLCGAGTLPAYRGRGMQKALLARRLVDAKAVGCDLAVVTTAPGSRSQENVMRRGFKLLYTRAVLIKSWD
ncbi:MAG: GNAT family N-acetyltransferase [Acidimicrobiia bacterium]|nr:GNAT family N-acetyltransferase [Acidimicrobiia bacterium]